MRVHPSPLILVTLTILSLALLPLCGCGKEVTVTPSTQVPEVSPVEGLSPDQSRVIAEYGYPDHFFISIDPVTEARVERWTYFSRGKALDFDNGRLFGEEPVEDRSAEYPPTTLRPQDFTPHLTPEEATALLGEPLFTHEVRDSLFPENTIVVYEKAVLLYRDERLIGMDTQVHPPSIPNLSTP